MRIRRWRRLHEGVVPGRDDDAADDDNRTVDLMTPHRAPSVQSDFLVPFFQATTTGFLVGTAIAAVLWALAGSGFVKTSVVAVAVCSALAWLWRLAASHETLWRIERYMGDLDGDGIRGRPEPGPQQHILALNPYQGRQAQRSDELDRLRGEFVHFVMACAVDTSARRWEKKLGRERYQQWRDVLIKSGYGRWRNEDDPKGGWLLTANPQDVVRALQGRALDAPQNQ
jgi:hypothetical protein